MAQRKPIPTANDHPEEIPLDEVTANFVPKTELGRRLLALRADDVRSGIPMLNDEDSTANAVRRAAPRSGSTNKQHPEQTSNHWNTRHAESTACRSGTITDAERLTSR